MLIHTDTRTRTRTRGEARDNRVTAGIQFIAKETRFVSSCECNEQYPSTAFDNRIYIMRYSRRAEELSGLRRRYSFARGSVRTRRRGQQ